MTSNPRERRVQAIATATTTAMLTVGMLVPSAGAQETATFSISNVTDLHGHIAQASTDGAVTEPGGVVLNAVHVVPMGGASPG